MQNASPKTKDRWPLNEAIWIWYQCVVPLSASRPQKVRRHLAILRQTSHPLLSVENQLNTSTVGRKEDWFSRARLVGKKQADPRLFGQWLHLCDSTHPACKHLQHDRDMMLKQFWLINVRENHITMATPGRKYRYLALSYVWGPVQPLRLTKARMEELQVPGVLARSEYRKGIPQTIQDAMNLTESVGVEYLWVDTLCMPQDDMEVKQEIMQQMYLVYSNAVFTIVAAAGEDANRGLPGICQGSRDVQQTAWKLNDRYFLGADLDPVNGIDSGFKASRWRTRAWTYEEALFSSRMLVFTEQQVFWYCPQTEPGGWREDTIAEITDAQHIDEDELNIGVPAYGRSTTDGGERFDGTSNDFFKFQRMAQQYSCRELTKPYDALNAFSGVVSALKEGYSEFHWGIPKRDFAYGLCWTFPGSIAGSANHKFRNDTTGTPQTVAFPSWSWTNWRLPITNANVPQWKRESTIYGLRFRWGIGVFQRYTKFFHLNSCGQQVEIEEDAAYEMKCDDRDDLSADAVVPTNLTTTTRDEIMLSSANVLKCYTRIASVVVECVEHWQSRDMELWGSHHAMPMKVDREDVPSTFALRDMSGHWVTTAFVFIEDERVLEDIAVTIAVTAIAIAGFNGKIRRSNEIKGGVLCLLTVENEQGYFRRIGIAGILDRGCRDELMEGLNADLSYDFDIPKDDIIRGWREIRSAERVVFLQ